MAVAEAEVRPEPRPHLRLAAPPPLDRLSPQLPPPEQLSGYLAQLRRRGVSFDPAFDAALDCVAWPRSKRDAADWRKALEGTREGWRASFERWPQETREVAVAELARILSDELRRTAAA